MALPSTGELALTDIQTEFGGSNPISLSEYYAGGSYVPSGTTGDGGAIPTTGEITIGDFYGSQAGTTITVTEGSTSGFRYTSTGGAVYYGYGQRGYYIRLNSSQVEYALQPNNTGTAYPQNMGSRAPTTAGFGTIRGVYYTPNKAAVNRFYLVVQGTVAKTAFTSMNIQGYGAVTSASAAHGTFTSGSFTATFWRWDITPTGWDGTGTSTVTIS
tara:strand:+ start:232 stop:873 length:642 start_codon:yes stop_codon:yes gene_type:complete